MPNKSTRYGLPQTRVRGIKLLRKVMDQINAEAKAASLSDSVTHAGEWDQGSYMKVTSGNARQVIGTVFDDVALNRILRTAREFHDDNVLFTQVPQGLLTACDSAACFAGHTTIMAGDVPVIWGDRSELRDELELQSSMHIDDVWTGSNRVGMRERAAELLGIGDEMASVLFYPENTLADLNRMVSALCSGMPEEDVIARFALEDSTSW